MSVQLPQYACAATSNIFLHFFEKFTYDCILCHFISLTNRYAIRYLLKWKTLKWNFAGDELLFPDQSSSLCD